MKKLFLTALLVPVIAFAQTYPSPTFNMVTLQNPLTAANGGTGSTTSTGTGAVVLSGSPTFTGAPLAPTASQGTNTTQLATVAYTNAALNSGLWPGSFTTLSASGTVSGTGFTSLLSPYLTSATAAGTYATIAQATTALAATGGSINGVTVGQSTPLAGSFTALSASTPIGIASGGTGSATATGATSNLQYLQGATGSVAETVTSKLQQVVNAADFGALCNSSHDDTANIQAAVNTGAEVNLPTGVCVVTNAINVNTAYQVIEGQGRQRTVIQVPATFNLSAAGVFVGSSGVEGSTFRDFSVLFVQPDTAIPASLVNYPPAFLLRNTPRFRIQHVRVSLAITGIDLAGASNSGGGVIEDVEMSAFNTGITIDGSLDTIRIDKFHFWPFGVGAEMTVNQQSIFFAGSVIGILSGRCDGLYVTDSLFINNGPQIDLFQSASGATFGAISGTDFDSYGNVRMSAGQMTITSSTFTEAVASVSAINQTGGDLRIDSSRFLTNAVLTNPMIGSGTSSFLQMSNNFLSSDGDMTQVSSAGTTILVGNQFQLPSGSTETKPVITVGAGRLTASGNRATDKGAGAGTFISITSDDYHNITGNTGVGWTYSHPTFTTAVFVNNN